MTGILKKLINLLKKLNNILIVIDYNNLRIIFF